MRNAALLHIIVLIAFLANTLGPLPLAQAQLGSPASGEFHLPAPGVMVHLSPPLNPPILKGIKVHPENPFQFEFILDQGDSNPKNMSSPNALVGDPQQEQLKTEATRLIKYFLASLTIPENDLWVNLSPYEKNRIIPSSFGQTEMGRDLLAEDYMLKQITASLIYPEEETGKKFWKRIYEEAAKKFGTTNIPVNTFNKVWIIPEKAVVYENVKAGTAYIVESKLKVMLEQDYLALNKNTLPTRGHVPLTKGKGYVSPSRLPTTEGLQLKASQGNNLSTNAIGSQIVREIIIPELDHEVNEDKNFAQLRQVYNSLILATWYKKKIKDSILEQVYADKKKVAGVGYDKSVVQKNPVILSTAKDLKTFIDSSASPQNDTELIYQRYLQAFKKGAFNYIKEESDPLTQETIPRKYFSGGVKLFIARLNYAQASQLPKSLDKAQIITVDCAMARGFQKRPFDLAMAKQVEDVRENPQTQHFYVERKFGYLLSEVKLLHRVKWHSIAGIGQLTQTTSAKPASKVIVLSDWFENVYAYKKQTVIGKIKDIQMAFVLVYELNRIKISVRFSIENEKEAAIKAVDALLADGFRIQDIRKDVVRLIKNMQTLIEQAKKAGAITEKKQGEIRNPDLYNEMADAVEARLNALEAEAKKGPGNTHTNGAQGGQNPAMKAEKASDIFVNTLTQADIYALGAYLDGRTHYSTLEHLGLKTNHVEAQILLIKMDHFLKERKFNRTDIIISAIVRKVITLARAMKQKEENLSVAAASDKQMEKTQNRARLVKSPDPLNGRRVIFGKKGHQVGLYVDGVFIKPIGKGTGNCIFEIEGKIIRVNFNQQRYHLKNITRLFNKLSKIGSPAIAPRLFASGRTQNGYEYIVVEKIKGILLKNISLPPSQQQVRALMRLWKELVDHNLWAVDFGRGNVMWDIENNRMVFIDVEYVESIEGDRRELLLAHRNVYKLFDWQYMDPDKLIWQYLNGKEVNNAQLAQLLSGGGQNDQAIITVDNLKEVVQSARDILRDAQAQTVERKLRKMIEVYVSNDTGNGSINQNSFIGDVITRLLADEISLRNGSSAQDRYIRDALVKISQKLPLIQNKDEQSALVIMALRRYLSKDIMIRKYFHQIINLRFPKSIMMRYSLRVQKLIEEGFREPDRFFAEPPSWDDLLKSREWMSLGKAGGSVPIANRVIQFDETQKKILNFQLSGPKYVILKPKKYIDVSARFNLDKNTFLSGFPWFSEQEFIKRYKGAGFGINASKVNVIGKDDFLDRKWLAFQVSYKKETKKKPVIFWGSWKDGQWACISNEQYLMLKFMLSNDKIPNSNINVTKLFNPYNGGFNSGFYWYNLTDVIKIDISLGAGQKLKKVEVVGQSEEDGVKWLHFKVEKEKGMEFIKGSWNVGAQQWVHRHVLEADLAMQVKVENLPNRSISNSENGGIDLTPARMNLQMKMDSGVHGADNGEGIEFHIDPAMLAQLQNAPGFVPVIISVKPLRDLRGFLDAAV